MDGYDHATTLTSRFRDLDTNGHVNHAVYVSYLEQGRAEYFGDVVGVPLAEAGIVIAHLDVEYTASISLGQTVVVYTRVPEVGTSSLRMDHAVEADGGPAATATTTLVALDTGTDSSRPIPEAWRDAIHSHES